MTFKVRTFRTTAGSETWDFGDGSPPVAVRSDGNVKPSAPDGYAEAAHRYARPGQYLVRVERTGHTGAKAVAHLQVRVGEGPDGANTPLETRPTDDDSGDPGSTNESDGRSKS